MLVFSNCEVADWFPVYKRSFQLQHSQRRDSTAVNTSVSKPFKPQSSFQAVFKSSSKVVLDTNATRCVSGSKMARERKKGWAAQLHWFGGLVLQRLFRVESRLQPCDPDRWLRLLQLWTGVNITHWHTFTRLKVNQKPSLKPSNVTKISYNLLGTTESVVKVEIHVIFIEKGTGLDCNCVMSVKFPGFRAQHLAATVPETTDLLPKAPYTSSTGHHTGLWVNCSLLR